MDVYKIEIDSETKILTYEIKMAEVCCPKGIIMPKLLVEQGKKYFAYSTDRYVPVFATRVSKADVLIAENQYDEIKKGLADTLLDPQRILFSKETVYRDNNGKIAFLYYPAESAPEELCCGILSTGEDYGQEVITNRGIKELGAHIAFAIFAYCLFALINNAVPFGAVISVVLYLVLCVAYINLPRIKEKLLLADENQELIEQYELEPVCFSRQDEFMGIEKDGAEGVSAKLKSLYENEIEYDIGQGKFLIGRNPNLVNLHIDDSQINPVHAEIICEGDEFYIIDRCSRNGTYINCTKIEPEIRIPLYGKEEIKVGNEVFLFEIC